MQKKNNTALNVRDWLDMVVELKVQYWREKLFYFSWQKQSQELTKVNPDRNIFSIKCGTDIYLIYYTEVWFITITEF